MWKVGGGSNGVGLGSGFVRPLPLHTYLLLLSYIIIYSYLSNVIRTVLL